MTVAHPFTIAVSNVTGWPDPGPAVAAARAGAHGILNLEFAAGAKVAADTVERAVSLTRRAKGELGVRIAPGASWAEDFLRSLPGEIAFVVLAADESGKGVKQLRAAAGARRCLLEVTSSDQAAGARQAGFTGLIAKGHEAGGYVGEESTFVLL